ncbi:acyl carrier protein [Actinosynnema sp. NPDC047251]|uniref:Acyl carrier protein n=1 Tax=Saccharothrix espanaensis (strain ATCC 51144 / DSM 44229 / JCM 9112 / NBRC 15066 / NRRL 15764) TaxID=1179773 RepID=K0K793_SACES|nr:acyl carrier protein [Saccharothrix espanaensis]CCH32764.1 Acyl carrier protein [Saccharothrix espanaensis DSM 44229]
MKVDEELVRILVDDLDLDEAAVRPEHSLEDAGLDSLSIVELSVSLSSQLGVEISEEDLVSAATVGDIDRMVAERRGNGPTRP